MLVMAADYPFMDVLWSMIIFFFWVIWIWIVITVLIDIFRRHDIGGFSNALWVDLDVLSIAAPTGLHAPPIAIAALDAGVHAVGEAAGRERRGGRRWWARAQPARPRRVVQPPASRRGQGAVRRRQLGPIYYAKAGWLRRQGIPGLGSWFTRRATAGGGPLMDIGVHMLDMALHLLGEPTVTAVTAATYAEFGPRGLGSSPLDHAKTGVPAAASTSRTCRPRSSGCPAAARCCWSPAGRSGSRGPVLRHRLRRRRRREHRLGRRRTPRTGRCRSGPRRTGSGDAAARSCRPTASTSRPWSTSSTGAVRGFAGPTAVTR